MGGSVTIVGTEQADARETSAGTFTDIVDLERAKHSDIGVDVSGSATLTIQVSTTGDFSGEEFETTVDYDSATENIEQFSFAHRFVRAKVDKNLNAVEIVGRA